MSEIDYPVSVDEDEIPDTGTVEAEKIGSTVRISFWAVDDGYRASAIRTGWLLTEKWIDREMPTDHLAYLIAEYGLVDEDDA